MHGLQSKAHGDVGVRVIGIAIGVVHGAPGDQPRPGGDEYRFLQLVVELPVEVILGHRQQHLRAAVGVLGNVLHVLAPVVHVGHQSVEQGIPLELLHAFQLMFLGPGGYQEATLAGRATGHNVLGWGVVQVDANLGFIDGCLAGGRVMHLQQQAGTGPDQGAGIVPPDIRLATRGKASQGLAEAAVILLHTCGTVGGTGDVGDDVVQHLPIPGHILHGPNPDILLQVQGHRHIAIVNDPCGRDILGRYRQYNVGLTEGKLGITEGQRL